MRIFISVILFAISSQGLLAQTGRPDQNWMERIGNDAWTGAVGVTEWYDVPLTLVFLARNYYKDDNPSTKIITYPAMPFEQDIAGNIGVTGDNSLGSMDAWIVPGIILGSRVLWAVGGNILGQEDMSSEYAHAWTFSRVLMYNYLATELVKNTVRRPRPDGGDTKSFFSGHTSTAFVTSAFVYREVDDLLDSNMEAGFSRDAIKAASFGALYGWAAYVGYSRMADNKHYLVDVIVGAAVGTLIGNLVYDHYFGSDDDHLPVIGLGVIDDQPALSLSLKF